MINLAKLKWLQGRQLGLEIDGARQRLDDTALANYDLPAVTLDRINDFLQKHNRQTISWEEVQGLFDLDRRQYGRNITRYDQLLKQRADFLHAADTLLDTANSFYTTDSAWRSFRGLGRESIIRAYVLIEEHEWSKAISLANLTFELGKQHGNKIIQARAKIVETMAYVQQVWKNREHNCDQSGLALESGQRAVDLSAGLDDKRIRIKAHTWLGFAWLLQPSPNIIGASASVREVESMLIGMPNDYVTEDADLFKRQYEQVAHQQTNDLSQLAKILDRAATGEQIKEAVLDFKIESLLCQCGYKANTVARKLRIHVRRVRPVRDRLVSARFAQSGPERPAS